MAMRTLYFDCSMGASGDMIMGALYELLGEEDRVVFLKTMNNLIPGKIRIKAIAAEKNGILGTHMKVEVNGIDEGESLLKDGKYGNISDVDVNKRHPHGHEDNGFFCGTNPYSHNHKERGNNHSHDLNHQHDCGLESDDYNCDEHSCHDSHHNRSHGHHIHGSLNEILEIIGSLPIGESVKKNAVNIYKIIAEAEGKVHNKPVSEVHFHEVGTLDAIADIVGSCIIIKMLKVDRITSSPIRAGYGTVKCAHGTLPVPAPATALILKGIPIYGGDIESEMCTPTGAAIIKYFAKSFEPMPTMSMEEIGYGAGAKTFESHPNCLRACIGTEKRDLMDKIIQLEANIDDMTGEEIGYAIDVLIEKGALDVFAENIIMKKSRPGIKFVCLCREEDENRIVPLMFKHTSTLGIRKKSCHRYVLSRSFEKEETQWGCVDVKVAKGYGVERRKLEFDRIKEIARENELSIRDIKDKMNGK